MDIAFPETIFCMCSLCSFKKVTVRFAFSVKVSYLTWSVLPEIIGSDLNKPESFRFQRVVFKWMLRRAVAMNMEYDFHVCSMGESRHVITTSES